MAARKKVAAKSARQTTKKARAKSKPSHQQAAAAIAHRVNALLHTVRTIAQHEDELCTFWHATRAAGKLDQALYAELRGVLELLPSREYIDDLEALRQALPDNA